MKMKKKEQEEAEMNLTPMIDVTFMLIIFFMLVTKFITDEITLTIPPAQTASEIQPDEAWQVLNIRQDGVYFLGSQEMADINELRAEIKELQERLIQEGKYTLNEHTQKRDPELKFVLRADQGVPYVYVQGALTLLSTYRFRDIEWRANRPFD